MSGKIHPASLIALGLAVAIMCLALIFPDEFETSLNYFVSQAIAQTEWLYLTSFTVIMLLVLCIALSPIGSIRLGGKSAKPHFSTLSWLALIFTSTQGGAIIGLSIYQPLEHFKTPVFASTESTMAEALSVTMYTWGFHAWSIWALLAVVIGYYSYNRVGANGYAGAVQAGLGENVSPKISAIFCRATEVATLIASWFGLSTSLAIICRQLSGGIVHVFDIEGPSHQFGPVIAILGTMMFTTVALTGIGNGVKKISNLNLVAALFFVTLIFTLSEMLDTIIVLFQGGMHYLQSVVPFSFQILIDDSQSAVSYRRDWGMSFLMWWLVYSSMFAVLFSRISYGRTIRATILATCVIPTVMCCLWFGIMSGAGSQISQQYPELLTSLDPAKTIYVFLSQLPFENIFVWGVLIISALFLITTGGPAIYVLAELLTGTTKAYSRRLIIMMAICIGVVLAVSAGVSKFQALQSIAITISFPFSIIYLMVIVLGVVGFIKNHTEISDEDARALEPDREE